MDFDAFIRHPLFYSSPSPISLIFHATLIYWVSVTLRRRLHYKKYPLLISLTDAFFLVGFIILSGDLLWITFSGLRFLSAYPDNLFLVMSVFLRDLVGMLFCFLLEKNVMSMVFKFDKYTVACYGVLLVFFTLNFFVLAETPAWTDYTFAIRQNKSICYVLKSFLCTWVMGKVLTVPLVVSWFQR